ncbi:phosphopantetheine-binding protein [Enterobacter asburiae]
MKMTLANDIFVNIKERILMMKDLNETEILLESTFESLGFDSLDYIELQILTQDLYRIKVPDEIFYQRNIVSIKDIANYISMEFS